MICDQFDSGGELDIEEDWEGGRGGRRGGRRKRESRKSEGEENGRRGTRRGRGSGGRRRIGGERRGESNRGKESTVKTILIASIPNVPPHDNSSHTCIHNISKCLEVDSCRDRHWCPPSSVPIYCPPWSKNTTLCWCQTSRVFLAVHSLVMIPWSCWLRKQAGQWTKLIVAQMQIPFHNCSCRYASEWIDILKRQGGLKPKSHFYKWKPVTMAEMKTFIGAILNIGIIQV